MQAHLKQVVAAVRMQVPVIKTVMVMMMQVAMTTTTCMRPVWMLSLYSTAHSQRRAERGVARVKEASCSDTDRFGTDTNTRRQRHTSQLLMLRPTPRCSSVPSAVRAAVHHTHEACHPCGSRLCTVLYVPSLVRLPRSCHPSRGQGYRDNPPRCTAVEHAVKLIVEGQVASMTTSRDKRIATTI